jgi:hypothetical protein
VLPKIILLIIVDAPPAKLNPDNKFLPKVPLIIGKRGREDDNKYDLRSRKVHKVFLA